MTDQVIDVEPEKVMTGQISYCPDLGLYHHVRPDGESYFTARDVRLEIDKYLAEGRVKEAEFLAGLTAWARDFPHKVTTFYADRSFEVREFKLAPEDDPGSVPDEVDGVAPNT